MQMKMQATLTGVKRGKGEGLIDGKNLSWDYTGFFVMSDLPAKGDNARGQATQEYRFGKAEEFDKWTKFPLPCVVDMEVSITTNGKGDNAVTVLAIAPCKEQPARAARG